MATATKRARATAASASTGNYQKTSIGAKARAAAGALHATISQHLSGEQFGRHAAPSNATSVRKNNAGDTGYQPRHASSGGSGSHMGTYYPTSDANMAATSGGQPRGRHARR